MALNIPSARVIAISMMTRPAGEGAIGGSTAAQYRTELSDEASTRTAFVDFFAGPTELWDGTNTDDNSHPNNTASAGILAKLQLMFEATVVAQGATTNPVAANATISQTHLITAQGAVTSPVAAEATISQTHIIVPQGATTDPVAANGTFSIEYVFVAQGAVTSPVAAEASISQTHTITAQGAVTSPVAAEATVAQTHLITVQGAVTSPVAANGTFSTGYVPTTTRVLNVSAESRTYTVPNTA